MFFRWIIYYLVFFFPRKMGGKVELKVPPEQFGNMGPAMLEIQFPARCRWGGSKCAGWHPQ